MGEALQSVKNFALIAFTLLGVLFGMVIMSFIFGQLGSSAITNIADSNLTVVNETGGFINASNYSVAVAVNPDFNGGFTPVVIINGTGAGTTVLNESNYSFDPTLGTISNATVSTHDSVIITYTYNAKSSSIVSVDNIQNNSLQAIVTYSSGASTQFNTVSVAIILGLLIAVFLVFWNIFVKQRTGKTKNSGGSFG